MEVVNMARNGVLRLLPDCAAVVVERQVPLHKPSIAIG